jgi:hypothetical protein
MRDPLHPNYQEQFAIAAAMLPAPVVTDRPWACARALGGDRNDDLN